MRGLRHVLALVGVPALLLTSCVLGLVVGRGWVGPALVALYLAALGLRGWLVGLGPRVLLATYARLYARLPRVLWSRDLAAAQRSAGESLHVTRPRGVRLAVQATDPQPLFEAVELTWARLDSLVKGVKPGVERVLLFHEHDPFLDYVGGWFGTRVRGAAGLYFRAGPRRIAGSLEAFARAGRDPRALVAHELVHAAAMTLSVNIFRAPWLNEGLADAVALDIFEPHVLRMRARLLRRLECVGKALSWEELSRAKPGQVVGWAARNDAASLLDRHRFYGQASLVVTELFSRGEPGARCIRDLVLRPSKVDKVLRQHLDTDGEALVQITLDAARQVDDEPLPEEVAHAQRVSRSIRERLLPDHARPSAVLGLAAFSLELVEELLEEVAAEGESDDALAARLALELARA